MPSTVRKRPTREDRIQRQELDDGDPDDEVHTGPGSPIYHDDRDCQRLKQVADDEIGTDTRRAEQRRWHAPCSWCVLDDVGEVEDA